jgi:non-heme chloroperoxidase
LKACLLALILAAAIRAATCQSPEATQEDRTKHEVLAVEVEPSVRLEVLDWGGKGSPVILIPGLGMTAHSFDAFAVKLSSAHHVYGITPRGIGNSSTPAPTATNYTAARLGADVVAVMAYLKIPKAVLIGHSFGGEELSAVGTAHPEMVSGLIYLDAAYGYAFYDPRFGNLEIDVRDVRDELATIDPGKLPLDKRDQLRELLSQLPRLTKDLESLLKQMNDNPPPSDSSQLPPPQLAAMLTGQQKFTKMTVPVLAIFAYRHQLPGEGMLQDEQQRKAAGRDAVFTEEHAEALKAVVPSAHIVRMPNADHFVFNSNESEVLREVDKFIDDLPR